MKEILNQRSVRVFLAFGTYLVYELVSNFIESNYNLKVSYDDKNIVLYKQPITTSKSNDFII